MPTMPTIGPCERIASGSKGCGSKTGRRSRASPCPCPRRATATGAVWVPTSNDATDRFALGLPAGLMAGRVVGIHAVDRVGGLGTLLCLTQQDPAGGGEQ